MSIATELTALQTDITNARTAITNKGGTVTASGGSSQLASDIATIPSGTDVSDTTATASDVASGKVFHLANGDSAIGTHKVILEESWIGSLYYTYSYANFPENTELTVNPTFYSGRNSKDFTAAFMNCVNLKKLTINADFFPTKMQMFMYSYNYVLTTFEELCLNFSTQDVTIFSNCFEGVGHGSSPNWKITGTPLNLSSATNVTAMFKQCAKLTDVRFEPSTIPISIDFGFVYYPTRACIISIANGLNENATGMTVTFYSQVKTRISTLMGTVTDGVFTEDASGSTSLQSFITSMKGWTIA